MNPVFCLALQNLPRVLDILYIRYIPYINLQLRPGRAIMQNWLYMVYLIYTIYKKYTTYWGHTNMSAKIVSILNEKGGCGKTTITMNLAGTIAVRHNKKILIISVTFCQ